MVNNMSMINKISFSKLNIWDVKRFFHKADIFNDKHPIVLFGEFLTKPIIEKIKIEDSEEYKILGTRSYGKGVFVNRITKGSTLKMRTYQQAKKNHLFWCKVDTKNGAFGIITKDFADGVGSSNMTFAKIETEKANPKYVQLLFASKKVNKYMDGYVSGTTNRKYIKPDQLRNEIKIPLPNLKEQEKIVSRYEKKIALAEKQENEAVQLENNIEKYLFDALNLKKLEEKKNQKGLQLVKFKNLDRWDVLAKDLRILNGLSTSKYDLVKIGIAFNFPSKSWKKKEYTKETFRYIELGAIDENFGITKVKEIDLKKAPSRATQQIKKGDLLIGTTRPYLKRFAIVSEEYDNDICSSGFSVIEPDTRYDLNYLKEFLMSYYGIEQLKNRMTGGTYPAITNSELKEILIPFPNPTIQMKIGKYISDVKSQIRGLKNKSEQNKISAIIEFEKEIFKPI